MDDFTEVNLKDGTTVRFKGQLSSDEVRDKVAGFKQKQPSAQLPAVAHEGVIQAHNPGMLEQLQDAVPALKHIVGKISGREPLYSSMPLKDVEQLAFPERVYSPTEQANHPVRTAFDQVAGSLTSPDNLLLMQGMSSTLPKAISRTASLAFAGLAAKGTKDSLEGAMAAHDRGDASESKRLFTHAALSAGVATMASVHGLMSEAPTEAALKDTPTPEPKKVVSAPDLGPGFRLIRDTFSKDPNFAKSNPDLNGEVHEHLQASATPEEWNNLARRVQDRRDKTPLAGAALAESKATEASKVAERPRTSEEASPTDSKDTSKTTSSEETGKPLQPAQTLANAFEAGRNDTEYYKKAKESLGEGASLSAVLKKAQDYKLAEQQAARPGERGSLSFRGIPANQIPNLNPFPRIANVLDRVADIGTSMTPEESKARMVTRGFAADLALKHLQIEEKFKLIDASHQNDGKTEFKAFMDAGEGRPGAQFLKPEDQAVAQEFHNMFQDRWDKVKDLLDKDGPNIDNYLSHIWEKPGLAKKAINYLAGKRPIAGQARFLKHRIYDYASEGLDKGMTPITFNPIRMQMTAMFQLDKFIAAHELKDTYKDAGLVQWVKNTEPRPDGYQKLNDKIFEPKIMDEGKLGSYGTYFAPPEVAKIFNRYLEPGLRGDPTYDAVRNYGNFLNQMNLGVSGYHGTFITLVSSMSDVADGIGKIFNNKDIGGLKNIARGTLGTFIGSSARRDYKLGKAIQAEAISPTGNPHLQAYVDDLVTSGARFGQDPFYENKLLDGFAQNKSVVGFLKTAAKFPFKAAQAGVQTLAKPIMKYYVPRVKLGMAAHMMETKMQYLADQGIYDQTTIAAEMGKVWDSVDNRAGQMVYDNLFWNKTAKDLSFLAIRAVGWDYGSLREYGGAVKDTMKGTAELMRGKRPEVTTRMAFTIATPMVIGTLGAITTYLVTGKAPEKLEDYFYPPSGRIGTNGKPERMSFPSYMKDAFAFAHDPVQTAINKLHPAPQQLFQFLTNKDFYGTEIRGPGDTAYQKGIDTLKWYGKSFIPFTGTMAMLRASSGIPKAEAYAETAFGFQKAPDYITSSKAEDLAWNLSKHQYGTMKRSDLERMQLFTTFRNQARAGKLNTAQVGQAIQQGKLRQSDIDKLFEDQHLTRFESNFKSLPLEEALQVMRVADPNEKAQLRGMLTDKMTQLDNYPPEKQHILLERMQEVLK